MFWAQVGHPVELGAAVLRPGDRDHLDLLELVLAQHAGGVLAGGAGLGAEALGVGGHADRQLRVSSRIWPATRLVSVTSEVGISHQPLVVR